MAKSTIPTPTAEHTGTARVGSGQYARTVQEYTIGGHAYVVEADGTVRRPCGRCSGAGVIPHYGFILDGVCFECNRLGVSGKPLASIEAAAKQVRTALVAEARRQRKAAEAEAAAEAAAAEWAAANPALAATLATFRAAARQEAEFVHGAGPLYDLAFKAARGPLSEKQAEFAQALVAEAAERDHVAAVAADTARYAGAVGEKVTVTGTVTGVIPVDGYRPGSTSLLIIITGEGESAGVVAKTFTTAAWAYEVERGETVTVVGTVKEHSEWEGVAQTMMTRVKRA